MIESGKVRGPIRGKVARVLNSREIVINRGAEQGVTAGMRFAILDPKADDIRDPDTKEVLGSVYRPKVEVEVVKAEPKIALARTFKTRVINVGGAGLLGIGAQSLFEPPKYESRYETFKTNEAAWQDIREDESIVKTGDPVEQVIYLSEHESKLAGSEPRER